MRIAGEGLKLIIPTGLICVLLFWLKLYILAFVSFIVLLFLLLFFREPIRDNGDRSRRNVYAPADGEVIEICEEELEQVEKKLKKISIFMNVFNVHITYAPIDGQVEEIRYTPGSFFNTKDILKSRKNENNLVIFDTGDDRIAIRQVAGLIARRIVCDCKEGEEVFAGQRIGMIKFGSRVEVYVPDGWDILVKIGDKTKGGITRLVSKGGNR